jgi:type I restriction enzyme S subunit
VKPEASKTLKPGWRRVKFGDVVQKCNEKADPETSGLERYIAGDHMDTDDLRLRRWGVIGSGYLGPAFHMRFKPGQVLYGSRRTYLRKVAVADFDGICANTTFVLEPKNPAELMSAFLPFLMQTDAFNDFSVKSSKGSVNPYINFSDLARFEFALPPVDEQQALSNLLRAATELSQSQEEAVRTVECLLQAFKNEAIGDRTAVVAKNTVLGDVLSGSPDSGCSAPPRDADTGYFVLGLAALSRQGYVTGDFKSVEPTVKMMSAKLSRGDLLISRSNTPDRVGYVGIFDDERHDVSFPDTMMRLKPNLAVIDPTYLEAVLQTNSAREYLMRIAAGTSASMKKINRANLLKMPLEIPSIDAQKATVEKLHMLGAALALQRGRLGATRMLSTQIFAAALDGGGNGI